MEAAFLNSATLYQLAADARDHIQCESEREPDKRDALVAVIFAAATLEALIMELAHLSKGGGVLIHEPRQVVLFSEMMEALEVARVPASRKFLLASFVLTGTQADKGSAPYQDLFLLFRLRDAIIHLKPEIIHDESIEIVRQFRAKALGTDENLANRLSWLQQLSTKAVARWAVNVVKDVVNSVKIDIEKACEGKQSVLSPEFWQGGF